MAHKRFVKQKAIHPNEKTSTTDTMASLPGKNAVGQTFERSQEQMRERSPVSVIPPEVTNKTKPCKTNVRGAQNLQAADKERFNRGAAKPWKPPGRK